MILAVTPNPSLDKSGEVSEFRSDDVNRLRRVAVRAGGKGVNLARVLRSFGRPCVCLGFSGGLAGGEMESLLAKEGIRNAFTRVGGNTRTNWSIIEKKSGLLFKINEPGPSVTAAESGKFLRDLGRRSRAGRVRSAVVICGSLPENLAGEFIRKAVAAARKGRRAVVLDADGDTLRAVRSFPASGRPDVIKPNLFEAERFLGRSVRTDQDIVRALSDMKSAAGSAILTAGRNGAYFEDAGTVYGMHSAKRSRVTIPGAGDIFLAGFCMGREDGLSVPESVRQGVAIASASCWKGDVCSPEEAKAFRDTVVVRTIRPGKSG